MIKTFAIGAFQAFSGTRFTLLDPRPDIIFFDDIIHALSMINRFNGHTCRPYSVAEHLCRCYAVAAENFNETVQLEVLTHDFAEAYYQDIMTPLKKTLGQMYSLYEDHCQGIINEIVLGYKDHKHPETVKMIDYKMLLTELRDVCGHDPYWADEKPYEDKIPDVNYDWRYWKDCLFTILRRLLGDDKASKLPWANQP